MASLSFTTPKSILIKLVDAFQNGITVRNPQESQEFTDNHISEETQLSEISQVSPSKSKLNISIEDLKTISTALLHYKRSLSRMGEMERAEGVAKIDSKFYDLILTLDRTTESNPAVAA